MTVVRFPGADRQDSLSQPFPLDVRFGHCSRRYPPPHTHTHTHTYHITTTRTRTSSMCILLYLIPDTYWCACDPMLWTKCSMQLRAACWTFFSNGTRRLWTARSSPTWSRSTTSRVRKQGTASHAAALHHGNVEPVGAALTRLAFSLLSSHFLSLSLRPTARGYLQAVGQSPMRGTRKRTRNSRLPWSTATSLARESDQPAQLSASMPPLAATWLYVAMSECWNRLTVPLAVLCLVWGADSTRG